MNSEKNDAVDSAIWSPQDGCDKDIAESIEITVAVELCRLKMTLVEAMDLRTGKIIMLNRDLSPEVMFSMNNRLIGSGRLVQVEGRMGVQVFGIAKKSD